MQNKRVWEIDALRGIAIIMMVFFHTIVDLDSFFGVPIAYNNGFIKVIGSASAYLFMLLAGISSTFSKNNLKRGLVVLLCGFVVSAVTYVVIPNSYIIFGILQFMGSSMIIYHFMRKMKPYFFLMLATFVVVINPLLASIKTSLFILLPFGIKPDYFTSADYYPLFPYISFFFTGCFFGKTIYKERTSLIKSDVPDSIFIKLLIYIGKHSLAIYMIHQPVVTLVLYIIFSIKSCIG